MPHLVKVSSEWLLQDSMFSRTQHNTVQLILDRQTLTKHYGFRQALMLRQVFAIKCAKGVCNSVCKLLCPSLWVLNWLLEGALMAGQRAVYLTLSSGYFNPGV